MDHEELKILTNIITGIFLIKSDMNELYNTKDLVFYYIIGECINNTNESILNLDL